MFRSYDRTYDCLMTYDSLMTEPEPDGNPEPYLVHATGCKQSTLRLCLKSIKIGIEIHWPQGITVVEVSFEIQLLSATFPPRQPQFGARSSRVGFVVDRMVFGQVFSAYLCFTSHFSFHQLLNTHLIF
jgi:hypothetical protein